MRPSIFLLLLILAIGYTAGCAPAITLRGGLSAEDDIDRGQAISAYRSASDATKADVLHDLEIDVKWASGKQLDSALIALKSIGADAAPVLRVALERFDRIGDQEDGNRVRALLKSIGVITVGAPFATVEHAADLGRSIPSLTVAVAEFEANGVSASSAAVAGDWIRNQLVMSNRCVLVERDQMRKVLAEHAFQQTGCTSEDCAIKLGRILNARNIVVGSMGQILDSYVVSARLVDVETGKVIYGDSAQGKTVDELKSAVGQLGNRLADRIASSRGLRL